MAEVDFRDCASNATEESFGTHTSQFNESIDKMKPSKCSSYNFIHIGKSKGALNQTEDVPGLSEPKYDLQNPSQVADLANHSTIIPYTPNSKSMPNAGSQMEVRNRRHLSKPENGWELSEGNSSASSGVSHLISTPEGMMNASSKLRTRKSSSPENKIVSLRRPSSENNYVSDMVRVVPKRAADLCDLLSAELTKNFNEQIKCTLESAVDRILDHSEAENLMGASNWLNAK